MAQELQAWRPEDDALRLRIDRERDVEYLLILVLAVVNCDLIPGNHELDILEAIGHVAVAGHIERIETVAIGEVPGPGQFLLDLRHFFQQPARGLRTGWGAHGLDASRADNQERQRQSDKNTQHRLPPFANRLPGSRAQ